MGKLRDRVALDVWRDRGFSVTADDVALIDRFFDDWFEVYNREELSVYRSQESLFASHECLESIVELGDPGRKNRGWVSSIRMGYAVAVTERESVVIAKPRIPISRHYSRRKRPTRNGPMSRDWIELLLRGTRSDD